MLGWYFARTDKKLCYGDEREIVVGRCHTVSGDLVLCQHGLHASERILDALSYAPGPIVYRVRLSHGVVIGDDKAVAHRRTYLDGGVDITPVLIQFAKECALDVLSLWNAPQVVKDFLSGKTNDYRAASAAYAAAADAADAACAAADAATRATYAAACAARAAAAYAARAAACAARAAACAAADAAADVVICTAAATHAAVKEKQNKKLEKLIIEFLNKEKSNGKNKGMF